MPDSLIVKEDIIQEKILLAAKGLFQAHGLHKVTMDDVARAIGKGRSSLYYYYKSKDEIFDAVMAIEIAEMLAAIARAVDRASTIEQKLNAFCVTKLMVIKEKRSFYSPLDAGMDANALSDFNKMKVTYHDLIMKQEGAILDRILTDGVKKAEIVDMDEKKRQILIFVLLSSLHGIKREMVMKNNFKDIEPTVNTLTEVVMNGLKK